MFHNSCNPHAASTNIYQAFIKSARRLFDVLASRSRGRAPVPGLPGLALSPRSSPLFTFTFFSLVITVIIAEIRNKPCGSLISFEWQLEPKHLCSTEGHRVLELQAGRRFPETRN